MDSNRGITLSRLVAAAVGVVILEWGVGAGPARPDWHSLAVVGFTRLIQIIWMIAVWYVPGDGAPAIGLGKGGIGPGLYRGCLWSAAFGAVTAAGWGALLLFGVDPLSWFGGSSFKTPADRLWVFAVGGVMGPVAEEIFFRGIIYGYARQWGMIPALTISTALFAGLHSGFGVTQVVGGLVFAAAYEKEKMLWVPITIHVLGNMALFSLSMFFT